MKQGGAATAFNERVDQNAGQIYVTNTRSAAGQGDDSGAASSGVLVTLSLRAMAAADAAQLQLVTIAPVGLNGTSVNASSPSPQAIKITP